METKAYKQGTAVPGTLVVRVTIKIKISLCSLKFLNIGDKLILATCLKLAALHFYMFDYSDWVLL